MSCAPARSWTWSSAKTPGPAPPEPPAPQARRRPPAGAGPAPGAGPAGGRGGRVRRAGHADRPAGHRGRPGRPARRAGRARPGRPLAGPRPRHRRRAEPEDDVVRDRHRRARARRRARLRPARTQEPPETRRTRPAAGRGRVHLHPGQPGRPARRVRHLAAAHSGWRAGPGSSRSTPWIPATASTGTRPGATTPGSGSGTCPRSGTPPAPARSAGGPPPNCDFEHNTPYEAGGRTCLCNGGPKCRHDHRLKQQPGWKVDQLPDGPSAGPPQPDAPTPPSPPAIRSSRRRDGQRRGTALRFPASPRWGGAVMAGPGDEISSRARPGPWRVPRVSRRPRAGDRGAQGGVRPGAAGQRRIRPAGRPGLRGPDPRGAGRSHRQPPGRAGYSTAAHACARPERAASRAARSADHGGDRGLRGRVDVRVPRALAQGFRGRSPSRSRLAGLPDHPHLPVHSGHDPVAGRGSDGSVMAKRVPAAHGMDHRTHLVSADERQASRTWPPAGQRGPRCSTGS